MSQRDLIGLARVVGEATKNALQAVNLRDYGIEDGRPLELAAFVFYDTGSILETGFVTTIESRDQLVLHVQNWIDSPEVQPATRVM